MVAEMFRTLRSVNPQTAQSVYDRRMDQTAQQQKAPNGLSPPRTGHHPATGGDGALLDLRRDLCLHGCSSPTGVKAPSLRAC
jgi:hypothetical protein